MKEVQTKEQFQMIQNDDKVVMMFSAPWCGDCLAIEPQMPEIAAHFSDFTFYHIDRDTFIDECIALEIMGIPSFLIFHQGKEISRFVSKFYKSKEEIMAFIEEAKGAI
ncbi:MAG: thioredoxin family protein [Culicoidibacterales bacterium]